MDFKEILAALLGGGATGALAGGGRLDSFLHPEKGYQAAQDELSKYFDMAKQFQQPFMQQGLNQAPRLNQQAQALGNPEQLENQWAQGYQESPYAKQLEAKANDTGLSSASQQGLLGSSAALNNIQQSSHDIMGADRQKYLDDLMQKYLSSIGIGQNLYGLGAGAGANLSALAGQQGQDQASLEYNKINAPGEVFGKVLGGAADLGINWLTGGKKAA